jgi:ribonuclease HII
MPISLQQKRALQHIWHHPCEFTIGIDEVGLGCSAGPLVVVGVVTERDWIDPEVQDSKRISPAKREKILTEHVMPNVKKYVLLQRTSQEIDEIGVKKCLTELTEGCALFLRNHYPEAVVVQDGKEPVPVDGSTKDVVALPKADDLIPAVSAASIIAKVTRDKWMVDVSSYYSMWGFDVHKGYHTSEHRQAIEKYGLCDLHRRSYKPIKDYLRKAAEAGSG